MEKQKNKLLVMADGNSIHTEKWISGLSLRDEFELYLLTMNPAGVRRGIRENSKVKEIFEVYPRRFSQGGGNFSYLFKLPRIIEIVKRVNPVVITAIYLTSYGFLAALAKGRSLLCQVMIGTDIMVTPYKNVIYRQFSVYALRRGDFFVSSSQTMTRKLQELFPAPEERLLTQQYGVADEVVHYPRREKVFDFISNRAWVPNSNIPILLEIMSRVGTFGTLALIGGNGDPQTEKEIKEKIAALQGVQLFGVLPYIENIEVVAKSKFFFSVTSSDGASLSLMEAMALGAIPIVSNIEPNKEWVEDGVNGFVLDIRDIKGSAHKIEEILKLPESVLSVMRSKNYEIIHERGSLTKNMNRFSDQLLQLLRNKE